MTLEAVQREKIILALIAYRGNYGGTTRDFCNMFDISPPIFSRLAAGDRDKVIGNDRLVKIGRKLDVNFRNLAEWKIVKTPTYEYVWTLLEYCQQNGESMLLVDQPEIGKTATARDYMVKGRNVFYVDCSLVKTRVLFIKALAKAVGVSQDGRLNDILKDTYYSLQNMDKPVVILDEAGDLQYEAWLEVKAYWNALEGFCGWFMMGADGLKSKIDSNVASHKVGYAEIFSRFGATYKRASPDPRQKAELSMYLTTQAKMVASANLADKTLVDDVVREGTGLRRLKTKVLKNNKL